MLKYIKKTILLICITLIAYCETALAYPYNPDDASDYVALKCNGIITNTSSFNSDGSEYSGNGSEFGSDKSNPNRYWVNWNGSYCYIKQTIKHGNTYECQYATNEWVKIQDTSGGNKYKLYYFDSDGYLDPNTPIESGYEGLTYNASGKVLTGGSNFSKNLKLQVYEDLDWFEFPEDSNRWYYGYEEEDSNYGTVYKFLKNGYAVIIDEYGDTYSLYKFDGSFNAHYVEGFKEKSLDYIKANVSDEINNNAAEFTIVTLETEDMEGDWEDVESIVTHEIITPHKTTTWTEPDKDVEGKKFKYYGNSKLQSLKNIYDAFEVFKQADFTGFSTYDPQQVSFSENEGDAVTKLPGTGWRYGDSPLYAFHTRIRMPSAMTGDYRDNPPEQISTFSPMWLLPDGMIENFAASFAVQPSPLYNINFSSDWKSLSTDLANNLDDGETTEPSDSGVSWTTDPKHSVKIEDNSSEPWKNIPPNAYKCKDPDNHDKTHLPKHKESKIYTGNGHGKDITYDYVVDGQQACEGDIKVSVDLSPLAGLVKDNLPIQIHELIFPNSNTIFAAPEQHGNISAELRSYNDDNTLKEPMTTTIQPWTLWGTGQQFGFTYPKTMVNGHQQNEIADTSTINILANTKYFYPHIRKRYISFEDHSTWHDVYLVAHRYTAMQDNILVKVSTNPINKPTLHVDSVWSGWANDINGIVNTGVTTANGRDKDVVVQGGSTMFISTKNTPKQNGQVGNNDLDVAKMGVTVYINSCYGNEQHFTVADYANIPKDESAWTFNEDPALKNQVGVGFYPIVSGSYGMDGDSPDGFMLGDELPAFKMSQRNSKWYSKTHKSIYKMTEAAQAIQNFFNDMHKNLGHYRLEKVMAEGVFTQGQEAQFDAVVKEGVHGGVVSGVNARTTFGSFGQGNKSYNKARTEQTSNIGNKLNTEDSKYQLNQGDYNGDEYDNRIGVSCDFADIHTFWAGIDIHETDNEAYLIYGKDSKSPKKIALSEYKPDNNLQVQKLLDKLGDEWRELEIDTGFLRNILTSTIHQKGAKTTRPADAAMKRNVGTRPYGSKWYNEGVSYFFITRGQAQYTIKLNEEKVEVMDPALCGLTENAYDLRNWNVNEDESYTVMGTKIPLKNKIRTFRYQLSPIFSYEESNTTIPANNQTNASKGEGTYLGRIQHPLKDTDYDEEDDAVVGSANYYPTHLASLYDDIYVDVYCQEINLALKSKLMYLTNATVQDNQK